MHFGYNNFMGFGMILFWVLLIGVIILVVKMFLDSSGKRQSESVSALEILKRRYASGEITREEFDEKKKDLVVR